MPHGLIFSWLPRKGKFSTQLYFFNFCYHRNWPFINQFGNSHFGLIAPNTFLFDLPNAFVPLSPIPFLFRFDILKCFFCLVFPMHLSRLVPYKFDKNLIQVRRSTGTLEFDSRIFTFELSKNTRNYAIYFSLLYTQIVIARVCVKHFNT